MTRIAHNFCHLVPNALLAPGGGLSSAQIGLDALQFSFSSQATDSVNLLAMTAGGFSFRLARVGLLSSLQVLPSFVRLPLVSTLALGVEVAAFRGVNHSLHPSEENYWSAQGFAREMINFGCLKGAMHYLGTGNLLLDHSVQNLGMMLGEEVGSRLHLTPEIHGGFAERFVHASATNFALGVGTVLSGALTGHRVARVEQALEASIRRVGQVRQVGRVGTPHLMRSAEGKKNRTHFPTSNRWAELFPGHTWAIPEEAVPPGLSEAKAEFTSLRRNFSNPDIICADTFRIAIFIEYRETWSRRAEAWGNDVFWRQLGIDESRALRQICREQEKNFGSQERPFYFLEDFAAFLRLLPENSREVLEWLDFLNAAFEKGCPFEHYKILVEKLNNASPASLKFLATKVRDWIRSVEVYDDAAKPVVFRDLPDREGIAAGSSNLVHACELYRMLIARFRMDPAELDRALEVLEETMNWRKRTWSQRKVWKSEQSIEILADLILRNPDMVHPLRREQLQRIMRALIPLRADRGRVNYGILRNEEIRLIEVMLDHGLEFDAEITKYLIFDFSRWCLQIREQDCYQPWVLALHLTRIQLIAKLARKYPQFCEDIHSKELNVYVERYERFCFTSSLDPTVHFPEHLIALLHATDHFREIAAVPFREYVQAAIERERSPKFSENYANSIVSLLPEQVAKDEKVPDQLLDNYINTQREWFAKLRLLTAFISIFENLGVSDVCTMRSAARWFQLLEGIEQRNFEMIREAVNTRPEEVATQLRQKIRDELLPMIFRNRDLSAGGLQQLRREMGLEEWGDLFHTQEGLSKILAHLRRKGLGGIPMSPDELEFVGNLVDEIVARRAGRMPMVGELLQAPVEGFVITASSRVPRIGDMVEAGQELLSMEVMKTRMPIRAPFNGRVVQVLVGYNSRVQQGDPLIRIEASTTDSPRPIAEGLDDGISQAALARVMSGGQINAEELLAVMRGDAAGYMEVAPEGIVVEAPEYLPDGVEAYMRRAVSAALNAPPLDSEAIRRGGPQADIDRALAALDRGAQLQGTLTSNRIIIIEAVPGVGTIGVRAYQARVLREMQAAQMIFEEARAVEAAFSPDRGELARVPAAQAMLRGNATPEQVTLLEGDDWGRRFLALLRGDAPPRDGNEGEG